MSSFRRYTNLAATIHLLRNKSITLLNPATWDDKNDAYFMAEYKRYKKAKTVLALCFAECQETYHHWRVFSNGSDGVCIEFDREKLLSTFAEHPQISSNYVSYKLIKEISSLKSIELEQLPFLKRHPYEDEREFRVVYVGTKEVAEYQDHDIEIGWIKRITLSPWMSKTLGNSVKNTLKSIKGCTNLKIARSTLVDNDAWKRLTARVHE
ncbi:DUF2971 domain-containing protein [Methylocapsa sp. D3K7]|uniref:DUF2971 domain-containing protein n=1 Tax=Methylocapsa sp. D3K7 TaxID=3041435 RepID=UPI00244EBCC6|nr:DUF2971 domain-containing protein [Methylocapsa sp. D3K7]WGJ16372.1 DUF2971 domain-containing protein [Methylocapsa sp. D3K7]